MKKLKVLLILIAAFFISSMSLAGEKEPRQGKEKLRSQDTLPNQNDPIGQDEAEDAADRGSVLLAQSSIGPQNETDAYETESRFPLGGDIILSNSVGIGTFVSNSKARTPYYEIALSLQPRYTIMDFFTLGLRFDISKQILKNSSFESYELDWQISDVILTLKHSKIYEEKYTGIRFGAWLDLLLPSGNLSRIQKNYLSVRTGLVISKAFSFGLELAYQFRFSKNFHKYTTLQATPRGTASTSILKSNPESSLSGIDSFSGGDGLVNLVSFTFMNRFNVTYYPISNLYIMLDFMIFNGFTYSSIPKDKNLSSPYATGGRGQRDSTWGTVEIGYGILDNLWIDLGILTVQMPKSADNESFRFPFFDFSSAANNQTTIYFDIVGTF